MTFSQEHYLNLFNNLEQFDDNSFAELRLQTQLQNRNFLSTNGIRLYLQLFSLQIFTPQLSSIKETNCRRNAT